MPALTLSAHTARITWLGRVPDRAASLRAASTDRLEATFDGVAGEAHSGAIRPSCSRVAALYLRGTSIRNVRQLTILSAEELAVVAEQMGEPSLDPAWVGATMVVEGIPDFTHVPPSSRLQSAAGTTLTVDMENLPCQLPAKVIDEDRPGAGRAFKTAAKGRRGVTAWVEREGPLAVGDELKLFVPAQRPWQVN